MNASVISSPPIDELDLVSSLYGLGPVVGWLLSSLSVLLSWIVASPHSQESRLSADFVATTLFPAVAAGDVILQLVRFPLPLREITTTDATIQQKIHALEAPLALLECYMIISVPLNAMAWFCNYKGKAAVLTFIYASIIGIEFALFALVPVPGSHLLGRLNNFNRAYLMDDVLLWLDACVLMVLLLDLSLEFCLFFKLSSTLSANHDLEQRLGFGHRTKSEIREYIRIIGLPFLWLCGLTLSLPEKNERSPLPALANGFARPWPVHLLPRARGSITDLDQIVPVLSGAYILALKIYNLVRELLQRPVRL